MSTNQATHTRSPAIDLLKALAIVAVICLHSLSWGTLHAMAASFHLWQAVPVFIILLGVNGAAALRRRGPGRLREMYVRDYLAARFDRIYVPFVFACGITLLLVFVVRGTHPSVQGLAGDLLTGQLPIDGPGNYFITLLFQAVLLLPLLYRAIVRWPVRSLLGCFALGLCFEVLAQRSGLESSHPYLYEACILRGLPLLAVGCAISGTPPARLLRAPWLWIAALLSAGCIAAAQFDSAALTAGEPTASTFYPVLLVVLGMVGLRGLGGLPVRAGVEVGRASYHIFLLQILWFGLTVRRWDSLPALLVGLAVTIAAGVLFYELMSRVPLPSAAQLAARRWAPLAPQIPGSAGGAQNVGA